MKKIGIVQFLGTNCDRDVYQSITAIGRQPEYLWFKDLFSVDNYDAVILPGGFSYGDYLRTGALSARAPIMKSVSEAAKKGVPILGICNGFQILCEAGLLPGVLMRNQNTQFIDEWVDLKIQNTECPWTSLYKKEQAVHIPIAHGEGRYYLPDDQLKKLLDQKQVLCSYKENPNGSVYDIAGVTNQTFNVAALMPHPERAIYDWMGSDNGKDFFKWLQ